MSSATRAQSTTTQSALLRMLVRAAMPALALVTAFVLGALVILITSGNLGTVGTAFWGLIYGALIKPSGLSESLVATVPYILLSLAVAVGFKSSLFNIGAEGQFYIGAISAAFVGQAFHGLPAIIHLPLTLGAGALGGAIWAGIPGYLKARTGAHEVISTMMMNYVAFRFAEYLVSFPLKDRLATAVQTPRVSSAAELWTFADIPARLQDPLNALAVALVMTFLAYVLIRWLFARRLPRRLTRWGIAVAVGLITFAGLPPLTRLWWPFTNPYDRLHTGLLLAILAAVGMWWLLWKTTIGFEMRTVGANPTAARYAGVSITRNIILVMAISGALAGLAGTVEVLGVSICRCLPLFFSSGYGFDSIAIALLANNNPFGILAASFLFGAMRNGADTMELYSGVSKYVISVIQSLLLLFAAAPAVVRWMYRIRVERRVEEEAVAMHGWGGG
jgi:general nucleoside transport system permease protein